MNFIFVFASEDVIFMKHSVILINNTKLCFLFVSGGYTDKSRLKIHILNQLHYLRFSRKLKSVIINVVLVIEKNTNFMLEKND